MSISTYCAFDLVRKKQYYGSTNDLSRRIKSHLENKGEGNNLFHNVLRKRPETFFWVELCTSDSREEEQFLLDFYCSSEWVYNISNCATGFALNNDISGTRDRVLIHFLDIKQVYVDKEVLSEYLEQGWELGILEKHREAYFRNQTENAKEKISKTLKESHKAGLVKIPNRFGKNNPFFGKTHTEEVRKKLNANKGRTWCNDGKTNLFLKKGQDIPQGYVKGRLKWIEASSE